MEPHAVAAHARERLGMEPQATTLLGAQSVGRPRLEVWSLMTEHGWFWLVEEGGAVELFRGFPGGIKSADVAARQFLELHREGRSAPHRQQAAAAPGEYACCRCGVRVTPRQWSAMVNRQLCRRCRHLEHERERYRDDPEYRARKLAANRAADRAARGRAASY